MKKFLALILAAMMLLSCTVALADKVLEDVYVGADEIFDKTTDTTGKQATQNTDVWLQVTADGQIDVTVPLVVVFKTNIDGGTDSTDTDTYVITNNSTAALKVTQVVITDQNTDVTTNGVKSNMTLVKTLPTDGTVDKYTLEMLPEDHYADQQWTALENVAAGGKFTAAGLVYTATSDADETKGLWRIERKGTDGDGKVLDNVSNIELKLSTTELSFVTKKASNDDAAVQNGIKLFNVAYTVKIDDSFAIGGDIEGTGDGAIEYAYPAN